MREVIDLTAELIRFRSTADHPEEIARSLDYVESYFTDHGVACRRVEHEGVQSLMALPRDDYAEVLLMTHVDVVPGASAQFEPVERDGRLYGRGSIDDKYGVALSMVLMKENIVRLRGMGKSQGDSRLGVLITGDEEVGGYLGARKVLEQLRCAFCIALDGGSLNKIVTREKGMTNVRLVAHGRCAHGAYPWQGVNAADLLIDDLVKVRGLFGETSEDHWHKTCNLGIIRGGEAPNQVPDRAEAVLNIRYTEKDNIDEVIEAIRQTVVSEVVVEINEPVFSGGESSYLERLLTSAPGSTVGVAHGASDARFLNDHGLDGVVWNADGGGSAHGPEEYVDTESVRRMYSMLDDFVRKLGA